MRCVLQGGNHQRGGFEKRRTSFALFLCFSFAIQPALVKAQVPIDQCPLTLKNSQNIFHISFAPAPKRNKQKKKEERHGVKVKSIKANNTSLPLCLLLPVSSLCVYQAGEPTTGIRIKKKKSNSSKKKEKSEFLLSWCISLNAWRTSHKCLAEHILVYRSPSESWCMKTSNPPKKKEKPPRQIWLRYLRHSHAHTNRSWRRQFPAETFCCCDE